MTGGMTAGMIVDTIVATSDELPRSPPRNPPRHQTEFPTEAPSDLPSSISKRPRIAPGPFRFKAFSLVPSFGLFYLEDEALRASLATSRLHSLDLETVFPGAHRRDQLLFGQLLRRLKDDFLFARLVASSDFDVFLKVLIDNTIQFFERPTDVRLTAVSRHARHSDRVGRDLVFVFVFVSSGKAEAEGKDAHHCSNQFLHILSGRGENASRVGCNHNRLIPRCHLTMARPAIGGKFL